MRRRLKDLLYYLFPLIYFIFFAKFIFDNTSNIPYGDEWDNLNVILTSSNPLKFFNFMQGGHPSASGLLTLMLIGGISSWNIYFQTGLIALLLLFNCCLILWLKKKLFGRFEITDLFYPLIYLNINQWEALVHGGQIGHILVITSFLIFLAVINLKKISFGVELFVLTLIALFNSRLSMEGVYIGLFINFYLVLKYLKTNRRWLVILTVLLQWLLLVPLFYGLYLARDRFLFLSQAPSLKSYLLFIFYQLNILLGFGRYQLLKFLPFPLFLAALISIFLIVFWSFPAKREHSGGKILLTIFFFYLYSLAFTLMTTVTRIGIGFGMAQTTRYIPHTIFYIIASGFFLSYLADKYKIDALRVINFVFLAAVFVLMLNFSLISSVTAGTKKKNQDNWMECYVKTKNVKYCDRTVKYTIFWDPVRLKKYLDYWEKHHYSYWTPRR